jgi:hypothetical protein
MAVVGGAATLGSVVGGEAGVVTSSTGALVDGPVVVGGAEVDGTAVKPASVSTPAEEAGVPIGASPE